MANLSPFVETSALPASLLRFDQPQWPASRLTGAVAADDLTQKLDQQTIIRQVAQLQQALDGALSALVSALDAKDPYTAGHSTRVAELATFMATRLGMSSDEAEVLRRAGLLHDVGKIGIDDAVLRKHGDLTDQEFRAMKRHPVIGYEILKEINPFEPLLPAVLHHHECWDGTGYPAGLRGDEIPRLAQIIAVADAFDAMTSDRPYRKAMSPARVREIFERGAGRQWAPDICMILLESLDEAFELNSQHRSFS